MEYPVYRYKNKDGETVTVSGAEYIVFESWNGNVDDTITKCFFKDAFGHVPLGNLHSTEAPAIERPSGIKYWFLDGVEYTKIQWMLKIGKLL
jgi:hypothetical protein